MHDTKFKFLNFFWIIALVFTVFLVAPQECHAGYLDPGSGSTAVQWIVAGIAALSRIKNRIIEFMSKLFSR
jgi:hypothetical protein